MENSNVFNQVPKIYTANEILTCEIKYTENWVPGYWIPVRPIITTKVRFVERLKIAWCVFIGKYDALDWEDNKRIT